MGSKFQFTPGYGESSSEIKRMGKWTKEGDTQDDDQGKPVPQASIVPWYDSAVAQDAPDNKQVWTHSWTVRVKKNVERINLNELSIVKEAVKMLKGPMELYNAEVHLLWISHIPQNLFRENISFGLNFTQTKDPDRAEMSKNIFPGYLYTHHIFYPGHSIEMYKSPIPWEISLDLTGIDTVEDYVLGKLYVKICGSQSAITRMEGERKSEIITMAPLTQQIAGITLTRPRKPSTKMLQGYVKRGINSRAKTDKLIKLMSAGINVEGAALIGKLDEILKTVPEDALDKYGDPEAAKVIQKSVEAALRKERKTPLSKLRI
ncbi:TPA_asm: protein 3 [Abies virus 1]|uniref:Protein 3 n=1 Tax=Abies virus 1 TaxID=2977948 RepID=A0A9N7AAY7_9RHAB|nr:TPA_asm: protein 3 [Abies virus 1]